VNIKSVEIGSNHCFERNYDYIFDYSFQFLVHNYFPIPKKSFVLNIASLDKNIRVKSIKHIKKAIDFCDQIGSHLYTFHPGFLSDPIGPSTTDQNYDFQWNQSIILKSNYKVAKDLMYSAMDEIIKYSQIKKVPVAIETEGSLNKCDHLLMQKPKEYEEFMKKYDPTDIGINLNIGHLGLASKAFNFQPDYFVSLICDYVVAMELSHNNFFEDQHLPLKIDGWYWPIINDTRLKSSYKILEFRNTPISTIVNNLNMIKIVSKDFHKISSSI
jgi:sugar phosphate isomerase/epimerase